MDIQTAQAQIALRHLQQDSREKIPARRQAAGRPKEARSGALYSGCMMRFFRVALTALAMLLVMLVSAAVTLRMALHGHEVTVPDLAGMTVAEASQAALATGVDLNLAEKFYSTAVPSGRVLSQAPAPGSRVRHGWQVRVTESMGPQQVTIPDVVGEPVQEASMQVRTMQLELGTMAHIDAPGEPDMVLAQTPLPNAGVDQPRVNLLLSTPGSASRSFVMPSVVGMTLEEAERMAAALGMTVTVVDGTEPGTFVGGGMVAAQRPESGYKASRGDGLALTLAR